MSDLSDLHEESVSILTSAGTIRLFAQRFEDIGPFSKLPADDSPARRLRAYLPQIAARDGFPNADRQRDAIDESFCQALSDEDIERIAEIYLLVPAVRRAAAQAAQRPGVVPRADAETASHYLDRVLRAEHERQMEDLGATYATFRERYGLPLTAALSDLDRQAAHLRDTSTTFIHGHDLAEQMHVSSETRSIEMASTAGVAANFREDFSSPTSDTTMERGAELAAGGSAEPGLSARRSEREAEFELTRNIGWMTAQSANLLSTLSESATQFLRQFADAAAASEAATRRILRMALAGIIVVLLLAAAGLALGVMSFLQQSDREHADAQWRASVLQTLKDSASAQDERFKATNAKLQQLSDRQNAMAAVPAPTQPAAEAKETPAASHRDTRPAASSRTAKRKVASPRQ